MSLQCCVFRLFARGCHLRHTARSRAWSKRL